MTKPLEGRIALVTGASRGIGYHAALALAAAGAHVIALARTVGGLEELDDAVRAFGGTTTLVPLNMKDGDGLDRLGAAIFERHGKLDCLFGNAGILGTVSPLGHLKPSVFDDVMAINVTANFRLLRSMDPLLKASPAGRALFVTSGLASTPKPFVAPYAASKAALEAMVRSYAVENDKGTVRANLLSPGAIATKMRARYMPGEDSSALPRPETVASTVVDLLSPTTLRNGETWGFEKGNWLSR